MVSTLPGLTDHLVDDAAVFPPGSAALEAALRAHRGYRDTPVEPLVGPLLLPASAVSAALELVEVDDDLAVGVVADDGLGSLVAARDLLADQRWLRPVQYELRLPGPDLVQAVELTLSALEFTAPTYLELPPGPQLLDALDVLHDDGAEAAKFRCGPRAGDVPDATALASFLHGCAVRGLPFKLTAGLHAALPHVDAATGARQHGFLNTLAATASALLGGTPHECADQLAVEEAGPLVEVIASCNVVRLRQTYRSFGSCSITEPFDDLRALDLIASE
jgi:hypothetical protein